MGPTTICQKSVETQIGLFEGIELGRKPQESAFLAKGGRIPERGLGAAPIQTASKSKLVAEYITNFQRVTKGGLYIDGFAAPQSRMHEDAWTARRVLEIEPKRLRTFWLCDVDTKGLAQLRSLKSKHHTKPKSRRVFVLEGDFNKTVQNILKSGRLTRRAAIFALLDQRTTECHWATVQALAARKGRTKIELLYFMGTSWLHRSLTQSSTPKRLAEIARWWGDETWKELVELKQHEIAGVMASRFSEELDYAHVNAYPVKQDIAGTKTSFYLIHASDHPEAPKLMTRAYLKIVGDISGSPADSQMDMFPTA